MLIHVKEKEQTVFANYVVQVVLSIQNTHTYFEWIRLLVTEKFFLRNQMKTRQENVDF